MSLGHDESSGHLPDKQRRQKEATKIMGKRQRRNALDKASVKLSQLRKTFAVYNQTTGKSPNTIHWYNQKLELFERFLGDDPCLADFCIESARAFIADLQSRRVRHERNPYLKDKAGPLSSSYIQGFARALRASSTWLHEEGYTATNILRPLKPPRIQRPVSGRQVVEGDHHRRECVENGDDASDEAPEGLCQRARGSRLPRRHAASSPCRRRRLQQLPSQPTLPA